MTAAATISAAVLWGFEGQLASKGVNAHALGRDCNLPDGTWSDGDVEVPLQDFVSLMELAARASADATFGWEAGHRFNLGVLGELGEAISTAPNLGTALNTFARYLCLVQSTSELRLDVDSDRAVLTYRILPPDIWPRQQDAEFSLSIMLALMKRCLGADWRPSAVTFEHGPARAEQAWHEHLGVECTFGGATNAITLPTATLNQPLPTRDRTVWHKRSSELDRALVLRNQSRRLADRVASAILAALGSGRADQVRIARHLGLSRRSLHRKLEAEGTSFAAILKDCRFRLAQHGLVHGAQSLSQLALELGYSDQTAFARAFKHRCGVSPGAYRARCQATESAPHGG